MPAIQISLSLDKCFRWASPSGRFRGQLGLALREYGCAENRRRKREKSTLFPERAKPVAFNDTPTRS